MSRRPVGQLAAGARRGALRLGLAALAVALLAAGCGGSGETDGNDADGGDDGPGLSKEEYVSQVNEICRQGSASIDAAADELFTESVQAGQPPTDAAMKKFALEVVAPGLQEQIDAIRRLPPPDGDEDRIEALLDAAQQGVDEIEEDPEMFVRQEEPEGFRESNRLAGEYGLHDCAGE